MPRAFSASFFRHLLPLSAALLLVGCAQPEEEPTATTYEVRGVVRALPAADRPGSELFIHHEAVPEFVSIDGEVVGMDAMSMGFPVVDPALLEGVEVGDKVAFTLEVDWEGPRPIAITRLDELPSSTVLDFEAADDAGTMDPSSHGMDPGEMDHGGMNPSKMDHGEMDHGEMDHGETDHGEADSGGAAPPADPPAVD